jgi:hypothetical protein
MTVTCLVGCFCLFDWCQSSFNQLRIPSSARVCSTTLAAHRNSLVPVSIWSDEHQLLPWQRRAIIHGGRATLVVLLRKVPLPHLLLAALGSTGSYTRWIPDSREWSDFLCVCTRHQFWLTVRVWSRPVSSSSTLSFPQSKLNIKRQKRAGSSRAVSRFVLPLYGGSTSNALLFSSSFHDSATGSSCLLMAVLSLPLLLLLLLLSCYYYSPGALRTGRPRMPL